MCVRCILFLELDSIPKISHYVYSNIPKSRNSEILNNSGPKHYREGRT